ncbi:hypothetical protein T01_15602, partial [Trichinella spiralis]
LTAALHAEKLNDDDYSILQICSGSSGKNLNMTSH